MIGTCKLCQEMIYSAPVAVVGPERDRAEYASLVEAARQHMWDRHKPEIQAFNALVSDLILFLAGLLVNNTQKDFEDQQQQHRETLITSLQQLSVVEVAGAVQADTVQDQVSG